MRYGTELHAQARFAKRKISQLLRQYRLIH